VYFGPYRASGRPQSSTVRAVRSYAYVAALVWVAVGCALYGWQILSLAVR
jgi:hypothetical protein